MDNEDLSFKELLFFKLDDIGVPDAVKQHLEETSSKISAAYDPNSPTDVQLLNNKVKAVAEKFRTHEHSADFQLSVSDKEFLRLLFAMKH